MNAITIHNISKNFGTITALDGISFEVPAHTIFGVLGPNGAGKTTLFSIIAGFFKANAGKVTVLGEENVENLKGRLSILPQDAMFQSNIPIIDQLSFFLRLLGRSKKQAEREVFEVLRLVELEDIIYREAKTLSHGMYKRLALAQAFLGNPEVIILDEPTSGLDWKSARQIRGIIKNLQAEATIMVSSHNMTEMRELCDHVAILNKGELLSVGPVDTVTGTSLSVDFSLSRSLKKEELKKIKDNIQGLIKIRNENEYAYSISFKPELKQSQTDAEIKKLLRFILDYDIAIHLFMEKNKLEEEYLKLTTSKQEKNPPDPQGK